MAQETIGIGSNPNDGNGDPIRTAMTKINNNFNEMYSSFTMSGAVTVGNSTVNSVVSNTGGLVAGNTTANVVANSTTIKVSNSTGNATLTPASVSIGGLASLNTTALFIGNSTINATHSAAILQLANSTTEATLTRDSILIGNSSVNTYANSSYLKVNSANVTTNTFTLGSSTDAANGYTFLPNGFKMNWGKVSANASTGTILFTSAYTTNVYSMSLTSTNTDVTYSPALISQNSTIAEVRTSNNTLKDVFFIAIGK